MNYETCPEIEAAVVKYFDPRRCCIVPNVWWGLNLNHECDLFVLTKTGYAYEVEIKTSKSDIKADLKKAKIAGNYDKYWHDSKKIHKLYFAIPAKLENCIDLIPNRAGILIVGTTGTIVKLREAKLNPDARKLNEKEILKLAHLGTMRIWTLKAALLSLAEMKGIPIQGVLPF